MTEGWRKDNDKNGLGKGIESIRRGVYKQKATYKGYYWDLEYEADVNIQINIKNKVKK